MGTQTTQLRDVDDAIARTAQFYRRDVWVNADDYIEIWCEKEALAGVISEVTWEFDVPLMVSRGFSSGSYLRQAAQHITGIGKPTFIYQFGDHDPSGLWITEQIERDLQRHLEDIGEFDLDEFCFERVAVTAEQTAEWKLPTRPTKRDNNTHAKNFKGDSVELDAIPVVQLHELVRDRIEQHVDRFQLEMLRTIEKDERRLLRGLAGMAGGQQ